MNDNKFLIFNVSMLSFRGIIEFFASFVLKMIGEDDFFFRQKKVF